MSTLQLVRQASAHGAGACQVAHVLSHAELGRYPGSLFASLVDVCDGHASCSTTVVDPRKLVIDSPLTAHPAALELSVSLYKHGCFTPAALGSLLHHDDSSGTSDASALSAHAGHVLLQQLLDYLAIPGPVSRWLPPLDAAAQQLPACSHGCVDAHAMRTCHGHTRRSVQQLLFTAAAVDAVDIMVACRPERARPHETGGWWRDSSLGATPGTAFLLLAGATRVPPAATGPAATPGQGAVSATSAAVGSRPSLAVHILPPDLQQQRQGAQCAYVQHLQPDGSSTLHCLRDVLHFMAPQVAGASASCSNCVGREHPQFGPAVFEALLASSGQAGAGGSSGTVGRASCAYGSRRGDCSCNAGCAAKRTRLLGAACTVSAVAAARAPSTALQRFYCEQWRVPGPVCGQPTHVPVWVLHWQHA